MSIAPTLPPEAPLRKYTADDIFYWLSTGFIAQDAKFELMDGELILISPKGRHHEAMRERLMDWLRESWAGAFGLMLEHTLKLDDDTLLEPDFILYDRTARIQDRHLLGADIRLVIEVADTSWEYDTGEKATQNATFGVGEYWVLHAVARQARIHRHAEGARWTDVRDISAPARLSPLCASIAEFVM